MILIPRIDVIAMAVVQMVSVGHIRVVVVRGGCVLVLVIAMLHIPVILMRWLLSRAIGVARAGQIGVIRIGGVVAVIGMERSVEVISVAGVGVVVER